MSDTDQLQSETEYGTALVAFWWSRVEEARSRMLEAKRKFWFSFRKPIEEWRPLREAYWTALDDWQNAQREYHKAKRGVRHV